MGKAKVAILGPGNIGTDLMYKCRRSELLEVAWMVGIDPASDGLRRAREAGVRTTDSGLPAVADQLRQDGVEIIFDATSAYVHRASEALLRGTGARVIDLTPAALGPYCIPPVNLAQHVGTGEWNVNMVSCGAQATVPMVAAVSRVQPVEYGEIVATVASKSIGPGTRKNIDEFTRTTSSAVEKVGGAQRGKAIIIINPANPPIIMRDTVHCLTVDAPREDDIRASILEMVAQVQTYVPGYTLKNGPHFDGRRVSVWLEVAGLGDYLPRYAGNLDIMTSAAVRTAEMFIRSTR
jgi:acetaldehyde/propanal dehydrogenase